MTPRQRGVCPVCSGEYHVKADDTMGAHKRLAANGYSRLGSCPGVDQPPARWIERREVSR